MLVADTIKGRGVYFMEHPYDLEKTGGFYRWHSGAPDDESFKKAFDELIDRISLRCQKLKLEPISFETIPVEKKKKSGVTLRICCGCFRRSSC